MAALKSSPLASIARAMRAFCCESMKRSTRPIGLNRTIDEELDAISASIDAHQRALSEEGVWLFLATLGCWSVPSGWMRLTALLIALIIFGLRYDAHRPSGRAFKAEFASAEARICALPVLAEEREEGFRRLFDIRRSRLGGMRPLFRVPNFALAWFSWGGTLVNTCLEIIEGLRTY